MKVSGLIACTLLGIVLLAPAASSVVITWEYGNPKDHSWELVGEAHGGLQFWCKKKDATVCGLYDWRAEYEGVHSSELDPALLRPAWGQMMVEQAAAESGESLPPDLPTPTVVVVDDPS